MWEIHHILNFTPPFLMLPTSMFCAKLRPHYYALKSSRHSLYLLSTTSKLFSNPFYPFYVLPHIATRCWYKLVILVRIQEYNTRWAWASSNIIPCNLPAVTVAATDAYVWRRMLWYGKWEVPLPLMYLYLLLLSIIKLKHTTMMALLIIQIIEISKTRDFTRIFNCKICNVCTSSKYKRCRLLIQWEFCFMFSL